MEKTKINLVIPDVNQPRKLFAPEKLATLKKSIQKHGIMNPIIVEATKDGKYLIVDGERRYRVATDLGLKEVPIIEIKPQSKIDRIIQQFHIQEQHEAWTSAEKAMVVNELAGELDLKTEEICEMLGIDERTAERYIAFSKLIDKENFQKQKINIMWVGPINNLKTTVRKIYNEKFDKEMLRNDEKALEKAVINSIKDGKLNTSHDTTKLKDSFVKDPKSIEQFLHHNATPEGLFVKTKAKGAYHLRNFRANAGFAATHGKAFMAIGDVKVDPVTISTARAAYEVIKEFLGRYSDI